MVIHLALHFPPLVPLFVGLLGLFVVYLVALVVYRLFFHPLARFPGPKLSAATGWYEFYVDLFGGPRNTFAWEIERMHACYGPMVRINPHEIHVSDPAFFDTLYAGGTARRDKYPAAAHVQGTPDGLFGTVDHTQHKKRRGAISGYFSKQSIAGHVDLVKAKVELVCQRFRSALAAGQSLNIRVPLLAYSTDVFCEHAMGARGSLKLLENPDRALEWRQSIVGLLHWTPVMRQFPWVIPYAIDLPLGVVEMLSQELALVVKIFKDMQEQAAAAISEHNTTRPDAKKTGGNLFHTILYSNLPAAEKNPKRMAQDAFSLISGSGDTVARTLTTAVFHLHDNPAHLERLREELKTVMSGPCSDVELSTLEALPWLTAVLKESLRISALIMIRAPLVAPTEWLRYQEWVIPPKTPVSMTLGNIMLDPAVFPSPYTFAPDRWLESNPACRQNHVFFFPFHRGHRNCIGMNLAWSELYLCLAKLIRRFDLELFDVVRERDIDHSREYFLGEPRDDSKGVHVQVIRELN